MIILFALEIQDIADACAKFGCGDANIGQILLSLDISDKCALWSQDLVFQGQTVKLKVLFCEKWMAKFSPLDSGSTSQP
jgi:hypothetical protein